MKQTGSFSQTGKALIFRLGVAVFLGLAGVNAWYIWNNYKDFLHQAEQRELTRLNGLTQAAGLMIDGDEHQLLTKKYLNSEQIFHPTQDSIYLKIKKCLQDLQDKNGLGANVYTLFLANDNLQAEVENQFLFGVSSSASLFQQEFFRAPSFLKTHFFNGGLISRYENENGAWVSAITPIKNSKGEVVAAVVADQRVDHLLALARAELREQALFAVLGLPVYTIILMVLVHLYISGTTKQQRKQEAFLKGQNKLNDILRGDKERLHLANETLQFLARFLGAQSGAIYLAKNNMLYPGAGYALACPLEKIPEFGFGEGLIGQIAVDKEIRVVKNIDNHTVMLRSGITTAKRTHLVFAPLLFHETTLGIVELAFVEEPSEAEIEFLDAVSGHIAIALGGIEAHENLKELVEETRQQSEELQAQQEELRQTNVELQKQAKRMERQALALESAKDDLKNKAKQLEQVNQYKSEFLANMSHELRTPLNSILILAKLLSDNKDKNLTPRQAEFARVIHKSGSDLLKLISEILDLAKVEAGRLELEIEKVSVNDLKSNLELQFREEAFARKIHYDLTISDSMPDYLYTDYTRVEQILKNLISNALKFTPEEGSVQVTFSLAEKLGEEHRVHITVKDTGIGIPGDKQMVIFEAFRQADGSTSRKFGGTGLGLSISREMAHLLGGKILVDSIPQEGSSFTLEIPVNSLSYAGSRPPVSETVIGGEGLIESGNKSFDSGPGYYHEPENFSGEVRQLLVIGNDAGLTELAREVSAGHGFEILVAQTGDEALNLAAENDFDAIILDSDLIKGEEPAWYRQFKTEPGLKSIPIHVVVGQKSKQQPEKSENISILKSDTSPTEISSLLSEQLKQGKKEQKTRALIVEDNQEQGISLRELLQTIQIDSDIAGTGLLALEALRTQKFDCLILDLGLPDMTGMELLEKIKEDDSLRQMPVLVLTGREISRAEEAALKKFATAIILKSESAATRLVDELNLFLHQVEENGPDSMLTEKPQWNDNPLIGKKLLLADDDMRNVFAICSILEEYQAEVITAYDGKEAIQKLTDNPDIGLVLMDIMMPEMDGLETTRYIRQHLNRKDLPIIALTAKAMKEDRTACMEAGCSDYLSKPVDNEKLLSTIRVWLAA